MHFPQPPGRVSTSPESLRAAFRATEPFSVGLEDEVMLLDPETLDLVARAPHLLERLGEDGRFKLELPGSQLEIITSPTPDVADAQVQLLGGRERLAARAEGLVRLACSGVPPHSSGVGELNQLPRYAPTIEEYGPIAKRQLVCALQVHVAVGNAELAISVYNAVRAWLPELAALAANAPFYEGRDTGFASIRPKLAELLPRQGVPPPLASWDDYAAALRWGEAAGVFEQRTWWWELRLHPSFGTLEFRVPDAQTTVADAVAVAAVAQALVAWLAQRHEGGEPPSVVPSWQIEENRWSAARYGVLGLMANFEDGKRSPTRERLLKLLEDLEPVGRRLGSDAALAHARELVEVNGALAQRRVSESEGIKRVAYWLSERFLAPPDG